MLQSFCDWTSTRALSSKPRRVALVSDNREGTSEAQFHPFSKYRAQLRNKIGLVSVQLWLKDVLIAPRLLLKHFDIVILKMSYRTPSDEALRITRIIRTSVSSGRLFYFDGDDDVCVQWSNILALVDLYVKKHVFIDKNEYLKRYVGKSNLHDYVHYKFGHTFSPMDYGDDKTITESGPVLEADLTKIFLGYNLALEFEDGELV